VWPHKDLAWWAFVLSVLAILAAYPIEVLAHITAPKWKNWWAERSEASMKKRVDKLEKQLSHYEEEYKVLPEVEEAVLVGIEAIGYLVIFCTEVVGMSSAIARELLKAQLDRRDILALDFSFLLAMLFVLVLGSILFFRVDLFRRRRSRWDRQSLRNSVQQLIERLAKTPTN
jgi:hypothetical protein